MVGTGEVLFLLGITIFFTTASPLKPTEIIEKHIKPEFAEKLTHYGLQPGYPPFISNFIHHGTNVFFKPHITLSPTFAPHQGMIVENNEDCKKWPISAAIPFGMPTDIIVDKPIKIVETVVSGAEPSAVDKVIVELPINIPIIPDLPPMPVIPVLLEDHEYTKPGLIPSASELPPMGIPEAPLASDISEVSADGAQTQVFDIHGDDLQPVVIENIKPSFVSEAPELPLISVHEIVPPTSPESVPAFIEPYDNTMLHIPQAPELPLYSPPELPVPVIMSQVLKECDKNKTYFAVNIPESLPVLQPSLMEDVIIPEPPVLSLPADIIVPRPVPEQMLVEEPEVLPPSAELPETGVSHEDSILIEENKPLDPMAIPSPPELPSLSIPELSVLVSEPIFTVPELPFSVDPKPVLLEDSKFELMEILSPPVPPPSMAGSQPIAIAPELPLLEEPKQEFLEELIPAPLVFPPMVPISLPTNVVVSESFPTVPKRPHKDEPKPVLIDESKFEPIEIPFPPVLSPMVSVSLPSSVTEPIAVTPELPLLVEPKPMLTEEQKPIEIPAPPVLPPMADISLSANVVVSESFPVIPELPLLNAPMPVLVEESKFDSTGIPSPPVLTPIGPIPVPEGPFLPAFVNDVNSSVIAETSPFYTTVEHEVMSNEISVTELTEYVKPVLVQEAPVLPPLSVPDIPSHITVEEISTSKETLNIPAAPELPPLTFPPMPMLEEPMFALQPPGELVVEQTELPQIELPNRPLFMVLAEPPKFSNYEAIISFPTSCVKNIVIERVLPNIVREKN